MNIKVLVGIIIVVVVLGGGYALFHKNGSQEVVDSSGSTPTSTPLSSSSVSPIPSISPTPTVSGTHTPTPSSSPTVKSYTLAQVAVHKDAASCWSAINGKVYDLTTWINQHPGGAQRILSICGKDGSAAFNAQHGTQTQPNQVLATFYIGVLAK